MGKNEDEDKIIKELIERIEAQAIAMSRMAEESSLLVRKNILLAREVAKFKRILKMTELQRDDLSRQLQIVTCICIELRKKVRYLVERVSRLAKLVVESRKDQFNKNPQPSKVVRLKVQG